MVKLQDPPRGLAASGLSPKVLRKLELLYLTRYHRYWLERFTWEEIMVLGKVFR